MANRQVLTQRILLHTLVYMVSWSCSPGTLEKSTSRFSEPHRLQFHFSPSAKWMNDPNGMVYYEGEYHLFYQYYPDSTVWGPMHWGHAVSKDLVHWEHLPIALYPDSLGYIFSGSAVVDWNNTSGFGENGQPLLVAIFTHHDPKGEMDGSIDFQYQSIAYSKDKGRTWTKYQGNPVIPNPGIRDFRDPKVIWDDRSQEWILTLAAWDHVKFNTSPNLKDWSHRSDFGREWGTHAGVWECPDLFPIPLEGTDETYWALLVSIGSGGPNGGSATQYFIGQFEDGTFMLDEALSRVLGKSPAYIPAGELFEDFETEGYGDWTVTGDAFGDGPADGSLPRQQPVEGYLGNQLVNSFHREDDAQGTLTSPSFVLSKPVINFLIGGGNHQGQTCMNLLVEGQIARTATGNNNETLGWKHWDVTDLLGKKARIQIVDRFSEGWGHIHVDQIYFADEAATGAYEKAVWLDYGRDNYAGVTWSDIPDSDGRRLFMGWMSNWEYANVVPTTTWRSAMTLPRKLSLRQFPEMGPRLLSIPVRELQEIRQAGIEFKDDAFQSGTVDLTGSLQTSTPTWEVLIEAVVPSGGQDSLYLEITNTLGEAYRVGYAGVSNVYFSDRRASGKTSFSADFAPKIHTAPSTSSDSILSMHLFLDVGSAELFADQGRIVMTDLFFPNEDFSKIQLIRSGSDIQIKKLELYPLHSIWK